MKVLGIDIGGSGIKGAIVNTENGELLTEKHRIPTPRPATPELMSETVRELVDFFDWKGVIGCSFPAVILDGKCMSAGNISDEWIGTQVDELFENACENTKFHVGNDADLAGVAEMRLGAGKGLNGKVIMITIGTGIGSGMFYNAELIPNTELGHVLKDGKSIEKYAADSARERENLSLKKWAKRFNFFLNYMDRVLVPNHYILGGGISKYFDDFEKYLSSNASIKVAQFRNNAGIIGAAMFAQDAINKQQH
ncbi:MAG: ROK family protein [Flavobacteriales bacterium]|nr:ROK family protein [Flavobacteriales bacterium]